MRLTRRQRQAVAELRKGRGRPGHMERIAAKYRVARAELVRWDEMATEAGGLGPECERRKGRDDVPE